ncbi:MAG TPA: ATP-dependent metallopeptidase FtsH/Yme1/Tma family protein, partial [Methylococcaceae bacterium]|nr:ATP-dependent metallopeptidase FtsH/Yme1/Tma family protein [Methylococcaceae bacterium]
MNKSPESNNVLDSIRQGWQAFLARLGIAGESRPGPGRSEQAGRSWVWYLLAALLAMWLWQGYQTGRENEIPYSEFLRQVSAGQVDRVLVTEQAIAGTLKPAPGETEGKPFLTVPLWNAELVKTLEQHGVEYTVRQGSGWLSSFLLNWLLPLALLFLFWGWMANRMTGGGRG